MAILNRRPNSHNDPSRNVCATILSTRVSNTFHSLKMLCIFSCCVHIIQHIPGSLSIPYAITRRSWLLTIKTLRILCNIFQNGYKFKHTCQWKQCGYAFSKFRKITGCGGTGFHNNDVIMSAIASQITSLTIVYSTVYSVRRSKKISKLRVTGLCVGNSPVTGEFPAQKGR